MTYALDICNTNISSYSSDDIISYASQDLLYCGDKSLQEIVMKIVEQYDAEINKLKEEAKSEQYWEGYNDACYEFEDNYGRGL